MYKIIGLITARGGSKGIPQKNIAPLAGKPLIAWTIEAAMLSRYLNRVIVSTDAEEIAKVALQWGAEVPFLRPPELAGDDSSHILTVLHALEWLESNDKYVPDYVMLLQPTSPLRNCHDIDNSISLALEKRAEAVVSVCEAAKHPLKTFRILHDGTLKRFVKTGIKYLCRQNLPHAYEENGAIYLNRHDSLLQTQTLISDKAYPYIMPKERSLDIDTPWDLYLAELILQSRDIESTL